jgi:pilus assembly protein Flp/PilA
MIDILKKLLREEDGPTAVEYAVMLAMIVIVCIGAIRSVGSSTSASFEDSATKISAAMGS